MTVLSSMACQVTAAGLSRPAFADILDTLNYLFKGIYGADAYIAPDSQDGQMLALIAKAIDDSNAACQSTYNSYSPQTAQGVALSSAVKINGIARAVATYSSVGLTINGNAGVVINNGIVGDTQGNRWFLPTPTTIGLGGTVSVTATAENPGAIVLGAGTVTQILTPTAGWVSATNPASTQPGAPTETDAALRQRQIVSVALPAQTVLDGVLAAILALPGVVQAKPYENDTNVTNSIGLPKNSISLVVLGGADIDVAGTILMKKAPGCATYGTTSVVGMYDSKGIGPYTINFYRPLNKRVVATVNVKALTGYTTTVGIELQTALANYVAGLGIGKNVDWGKAVMAAQFSGVGDTNKFEVTSLQLSAFGGTLAQADVPVAFNELPGLAVTDINLVVS